MPHPQEMTETQTRQPETIRVNTYKEYVDELQKLLKLDTDPQALLNFFTFSPAAWATHVHLADEPTCSVVVGVAGNMVLNSDRLRTQVERYRTSSDYSPVDQLQSIALSQAVYQFVHDQLPKTAGTARYRARGRIQALEKAAERLQRGGQHNEGRRRALALLVAVGILVGCGPAASVTVAPPPEAAEQTPLPGTVIEPDIDPNLYDASPRDLLTFFQELGIPTLRARGATPEASVSKVIPLGDEESAYISYRAVGLLINEGGQEVPVDAFLMEHQDGSISTFFVLWTTPEETTPSDVVTAQGVLLDLVQGERGINGFQRHQENGQDFPFGLIQVSSAQEIQNLVFQLPDGTVVQALTEENAELLRIFYRAEVLPTPTPPPGETGAGTAQTPQEAEPAPTEEDQPAETEASKPTIPEGALPPNAFPLPAEFSESLPMGVFSYDEFDPRMQRRLAVSEIMMPVYENLKYIGGFFMGVTTNEHGAKMMSIAYPVFNANKIIYFRVVNVIFATQNYAILPSRDQRSIVLVDYIGPNGGIVITDPAHPEYIAGIWSFDSLNKQLPIGSYVIFGIRPINHYVNTPIERDPDFWVLEDAGVSPSEYCRTGTDTDPVRCYVVGGGQMGAWGTNSLFVLNR